MIKKMSSNSKVGGGGMRIMRDETLLMTCDRFTIINTYKLLTPLISSQLRAVLL